MKIAILGAECTGKTTLRQGLVEALANAGWHDVVVDDNTPLMTAIYRDVLHADASQYPAALADMKAFTHVLVTALDLPWAAANNRGEVSSQQSAIHQRLREALTLHNMAYAMVYGRGEQRLQSAISAVIPSTGESHAEARSYQRWLSGCEKCSDPACEHRLFQGLTTGA